MFKEVLFFVHANRSFGAIIMLQLSHSSFPHYRYVVTITKFYEQILL